MKFSQSSSRILQLDGLRGMALLLVLLTHVPQGNIESGIPPTIHPIFSMFFGNGQIGLQILFILTGFLMASIYPQPKSAIAFLSKRFGRLLPAFLVMVTALSIIKLFPNLSVLAQIGIILGCALIGRSMWEYGLLLSKKRLLGPILVKFWLIMQLLTTLLYIFIMLRVPAPVYYLKWELWLRNLFTALVNATLTLPFGRYVAQLDGVYWTLCLEMLFYLLYPLVIAPSYSYISKTASPKQKIVLLVTAIPFFFGLSILFKDILGFGILNIHMMYSFLIGIILGHNLEKIKNLLTRYITIFNTRMSFVFLLILVLYSHKLMYPYVPTYYHPVIDIMSSFTVGLLFILVCEETHIFATVFKQKWLTFVGRYSYSLYLTHSLVIYLIHKRINTTGIQAELTVTMLSVLVSLLFSYVLFHIIEKPYFDLKKVKITKHELITKKISAYSMFSRHDFYLRVLPISFLIIITIFIANQPPLSMFSSVYGHRETPSPLSYYNREGNTLILNEQPKFLSFTAPMNNLGMITMHIGSESVSDFKDYPSIEPNLILALLDENKQVLYETHYQTSEIYDNTYYPFGFPIQTYSKGKQYFLKLHLDRLDPSRKIKYINEGINFNSVYFMNKKDLIKSPSMFINWIIKKVSYPLKSPKYWTINAYVLPFIITLILFSTINTESERKYLNN